MAKCDFAVLKSGDFDGGAPVAEQQFPVLAKAAKQIDEVLRQVKNGVFPGVNETEAKKLLAEMLKTAGLSNRDNHNP